MRKSTTVTLALLVSYAALTPGASAWATETATPAPEATATSTAGTRERPTLGELYTLGYAVDADKRLVAVASLSQEQQGHLAQLMAPLKPQHPAAPLNADGTIALNPTNTPSEGTGAPQTPAEPAPEQTPTAAPTDAQNASETPEATPTETMEEKPRNFWEDLLPWNTDDGQDAKPQEQPAPRTTSAPQAPAAPQGGQPQQAPQAPEKKSASVADDPRDIEILKIPQAQSSSGRVGAVKAQPELSDVYSSGAEPPSDLEAPPAAPTDAATTEGPGVMQETDLTDTQSSPSSNSEQYVSGSGEGASAEDNPGITGTNLADQYMSDNHRPLGLETSSGTTIPSGDLSEGGLGSILMALGITASAAGAGVAATRAGKRKGGRHRANRKNAKPEGYRGRHRH